MPLDNTIVIAGTRWSMQHSWRQQFATPGSRRLRHGLLDHAGPTQLIECRAMRSDVTPENHPPINRMIIIDCPFIWAASPVGVFFRAWTQLGDPNQSVYKVGIDLFWPLICCESMIACYSTELIKDFPNWDWLGRNIIFAFIALGLAFCSATRDLLLFSGGFGMIGDRRFTDRPHRSMRWRRLMISENIRGAWYIIFSLVVLGRAVQRIIVRCCQIMANRSPYLPLLLTRLS